MNTFSSYAFEQLSPIIKKNGLKIFQKILLNLYISQRWKKYRKKCKVSKIRVIGNTNLIFFYFKLLDLWGFMLKSSVRNDIHVDLILVLVYISKVVLSTTKT